MMALAEDCGISSLIFVTNALFGTVLCSWLNCSLLYCTVLYCSETICSVLFCTVLFYIYTVLY